MNLVAGADLASSNLLATKSDSDGGVYLSGASFDSAGEVTRLLGNDGEVALTHGDLTVRAPGDLIIGNGGGLKNQTGAIDVAVGRDVRFRAGSETAGRRHRERLGRHLRSPRAATCCSSRT